MADLLLSRRLTARFIPSRPVLAVAALLMLAAAWHFAGPVVAMDTVALDPVPSFVTFESGPVRPMVMTPSGQHLLVTNIPDGHVEVFKIEAGGTLTHQASIPVGLEPVAVAARNNREIWVVNHLSDSVSVVDLVRRRVIRTLQVGDEPRDIVFGGPNGERAFITTAHRGQRRTDPALSGVEGAGDPQLTTPGIGRADVWVFDAASLGADPGGVPLKIMTLFGDTPRALAVTPDGSEVYAAIFHSGNLTAAVGAELVCNGFEAATDCEGDGITSPGGLPDGRMPGGNPGPSTNFQGLPGPEVGLIVQYDPGDGLWKDELGRNWNNAVRFTLPDYDLFTIDAAALTETARYAHVGTTLFNIAVNPVSGRLYVSNLEAQNQVRFEGPGEFAGSTVQGDLARSRITVIDPASGDVTPRHLNKHIDYDQRPAPPGTSAHSLATPLQMVVSGDGRTLYVAAFGSSKVGVYESGALEDDSFDPTERSAHHISLSAGGPAGLVLDETRDRLFVYTRFDNAVSVVETTTGSEIAHTPLYNPEPAHVVAGRPFLYDANLTSSNGEASCASCHIFGDVDHLAWDLGNPDETLTPNPIPVVGHPELVGNLFHPMKGPFTTQTLRGLANSGAMHWRGDRAAGFFGVDPFDERLSFMNFIVAFPGLLGAEIDLEDPTVHASMLMFTNFALELVMPPNPIRRLDNSLTPDQQAGFDFFDGTRRADGLAVDGENGQEGFTCRDCHNLTPEEGLFGTSLRVNPPFIGRPLIQPIKVPQLRNVYQKLGRFGQPDTEGFTNYGQDFGFQGDQVRGFGFARDGSVDTLFQVFNLTSFEDTGAAGIPAGPVLREQLAQFALVFDSDLAPIVGQQVTVGPATLAAAYPRVALLISRARTPFVSKILGGTATECDLVVHGSDGGVPWGWLYNPATGLFEPDSASGVPIPVSAFVVSALQRQTQFTFTCVPPGSGRRIALDRDLDGILNADDPLLDPPPAAPPVALVP